MSQGYPQGAFQYPGPPPATLKAPEGAMCLDTVNGYTIYTMVAGTWTFAGARPTLQVQTVASLPAAAAGNKGMRSTVSDSNATTTAGIGAVVAAGGANCNPVYSDGADWRIG